MTTSDLDASLRVLVVCTGNVCRSPLTAQLLRQAVRDLPVVVDSAGTGALVGEPMPPESLRIAADLDLDDAPWHRGAQLARQSIAAADLVLTATRSHRRFVAETEPRAVRYTFTIREFSRLVDTSAPGPRRGGTTARERFANAVRAVAASRASVRQNVRHDDDLLDPFRQATHVYEQSAREITDALPPIVASLRSVFIQP
ncbi:arsenate reductase/protein-tyrosine-phosphatase family protein [Curtobacterium sp. Leaf261]|uniref:arsenate reductase/protein-tyrosine-phosphatase family protein n=1 Tax=Curtobacterium sp. Leaf261 TaxID=1736311 RepID=UPI0006FB4B6E|nr:low molecular weight phosphatase family protein [Curtobacterium sp. Leaf261]KQO61371.1 hypothetical protein ASF23_12905 [Curtobacterium sp. Leaf261]